MASEKVRIEVAFTGGQTIGALVTPAAADELQAALAGDEPMFALEADEGRYLIPLRNVVYVRRFSRDTTIGFGGPR